MRRIDLSGQRFARLVVIGYAGTATNGNAMWRCQCDCGRTCIVDGYRLRRGGVRSCGCLRKEAAKRSIAGNPKFQAQMGDATSLGISNGTNLTVLTQLSVKNHSGVIGVSYNKDNQRWVARLTFCKQLVLNKQFKTFSEAVAARRNAERQYLADLLPETAPCQQKVQSSHQ